MPQISCRKSAEGILVSKDEGVFLGQTECARKEHADQEHAPWPEGRHSFLGGLRPKHCPPGCPQSAVGFVSLGCCFVGHVYIGSGLKEADKVWIPSGRRSETVRATSMVNCESVVRCTIVSPEVRGVHQSTPKHLGYAKAISVVPPPL